MKNTIFAEGFSFKRSEKAPDFVVGRLSMKVADAIEFMKKHQSNGWINFDIKKARTGNFYVELDQYQPNGAAQSKDNQVSDNEDFPF